jgi:uncharacterized damage-inducible protein DinB
MTIEWTAPDVERAWPDLMADERHALEQWLDFHRDTLLWKCAGLTGQQLKERTAAPSSLSLLGLVRHMVEVERWWFRMNAAAEEVGYEYSGTNDEADFEEVDGADAAADLETFRNEVRACRAAVEDMPLDAEIASRGHHPERKRDLRWIYIHMIEEYARHNGHADLLRERIDGVTGD